MAPSSRFLAEELTRHMGIESASCLAELSPGTGVVTKELIRLKSERASLLVVEKDEHWVRLLSRRYPSIDLVQGCATKLDELATERQLQPFDAIVCGLQGLVGESARLRLEATANPPSTDSVISKT